MICACSRNLGLAGNESIMKISMHWLQQFFDLPLNAETLAEKFTMSGLEVDSVTYAASAFTRVFVAKIVQVKKHPAAQRLNICQLDIGKSELLTIVCGGTNVRENLKVAVAMDGACLPGEVKINNTVIRGEASQGMICSAKELGLGSGPEGHILELQEDAPVGQDFRQYLDLDDKIIHVQLTANRGDCLSMKGIAREAGLLLNQSLKPIKYEPAKVQNQDTLKIEIKNPESCPRYVGRIIKNLRKNAVTPLWMQERLRRCGIRPIYPAVDVTNYVMLELGQPLHAFDLNKINKQITVRSALNNEKITLLDDRTLSLDPKSLLIADSEKPLALAGVMGSADSGVNAETNDIFLESAFFIPVPISLTARRYGLQSDAAYRYARGVDFNLPMEAMHRATALLLEIAGGEAGPIVDKTEEKYLPFPPTVVLNKNSIPRLLGITLSEQEIEHILVSLGMEIQSSLTGWQVIAPSYRFDIKVEVDLIEELARVHGYQKISPQTMFIPMQIQPDSEKVQRADRMRGLLADRGYHEIISYSFVDPVYQQSLDPRHTPLTLKNPISQELSVMRTSLWPGLVQTAIYNQNRQVQHLKLMEMGMCFCPPEENPVQEIRIAGLISGEANPLHWSMEKRAFDFFDLKGDLENLLKPFNHGLHITWDKSEHPALHPGQSATLRAGEDTIGWMGGLHPALLDQFKLLPTFLFELKADFLRDYPVRFKIFSKFPSIRRDLALIMDKTIPVEKIRRYIEQKAGNFLNNVQVFDVYQGTNLENGKKSIALALTFQDSSRTLKDEEVQTFMEDLIGKLGQQFGAKLR